MEKDFEDFIAKRCETALLENADYLELEERADAREGEAQGAAEIICYKRGFHDALELFNSK